MKAPALLKSAFVSVVALSASMTSAQVVLEGDVLRVGVSTRGHLIDNLYNAGIGWAGDPNPDGFDFLRGDSNIEFYALGYDGSAAYSRHFEFNVDATTTDTSIVGTLLRTETTGNHGDLLFTQVLSFDPSESVINFSITLLNNSQSTMENVLYARGLDADPDWYLNPSPEFASTLNQIESGDIVSSIGPESGWKISIIADSDQNQPVHFASIGGTWTTPYSLLSGSGSPLNGNHVIAMAWDVGTLAPGASTTVNFKYKIEQVPATVPDGASTLALIALPIIGLAAVRLSRRFGRA